MSHYVPLITRARGVLYICDLRYFVIYIKIKYHTGGTKRPRTGLERSVVYIAIIYVYSRIVLELPSRQVLI